MTADTADASEDSFAFKSTSPQNLHTMNWNSKTFQVLELADNLLIPIGSLKLPRITLNGVISIKRCKSDSSEFTLPRTKSQTNVAD